jgi:hypothetical protein
VNDLELDRLEKATIHTQELVQNILDLANVMKSYTINQILAKDEGKLALDILSRKLKL